MSAIEATKRGEINNETGSHTYYSTQLGDSNVRTTTSGIEMKEEKRRGEAKEVMEQPRRQKQTGTHRERMQPLLDGI